MSYRILRESLEYKFLCWCWANALCVYGKVTDGRML